VKGEQIRNAFLTFFESKGHLILPSSSLIPAGDPTLLLTSAGMVQFKPYFMGETEPPNTKLTTSQKCFRATDIEEVGDTSHLTFFEMLGNFSVGDYFKEGAISYALEFVTQVLGLPQEKFAVTVYNDDTEAENHWIRAGIPKNKIYRFGDTDNWWGPAGDEGPCGPCSELHYDFGSEFGCGQVGCGPNCQGCGRFIELWNLVFMQFYKDKNGHFTNLPKPNIDTGIGLERTAVVLQGVPSIYETDLFMPLLSKVCELSGQTYSKTDQIDRSIRIVAEHARSSCFLIADGVVPGNDGRGYVLRRLIRRAIRNGRSINLKEHFLSEIADVVVNKMGHPYKELKEHSKFVKQILDLESDRFEKTVAEGIPLLEEVLIPLNYHLGEIAQKNKGSIKRETEEKINQLKLKLNDSLKRAVFNKYDRLLKTDEKAIKTTSTTLSGLETFVLYDTFGFPPELTVEIAKENGFKVDLDDFKKVMENQKNLGRSKNKFGGEIAKIRIYQELDLGGTQFLGYDKTETSSVVVGLIFDGSRVTEVSGKGKLEVILMETTFYPEGGGQVGDAGILEGTDCVVSVSDTQSPIPGMIVHICQLNKGTIAIGDTIYAKVDLNRRNDTARNHTATHLVHAALREVLGNHVRQGGSLVASDRIRFDFTHVSPISYEDKINIQNIVNKKIRDNVLVHKKETTYRDAIDNGALAFFGDKYGDKVRVIEVSNGSRFSYEVCGGTHIQRTGEIGSFYILSDSSIGSGLRRIEAVAGRAAEEMVSSNLKLLANLAKEFQTPISEIERRAHNLTEEKIQSEKKAEKFEKDLLKLKAQQFKQYETSGIQYFCENISVSNSDSLREIGDSLRHGLKNGVIILGSIINKRPALLVMATPELVRKGFNAGDIVQQAAKIIDGGGGGRPDVGQAGGKTSEKIDLAIKKAEDLLINWGKQC